MLLCIVIICSSGAFFPYALALLGLPDFGTSPFGLLLVALPSWALSSQGWRSLGLYHVGLDHPDFRNIWTAVRGVAAHDPRPLSLSRSPRGHPRQCTPRQHPDVIVCCGNTLLPSTGLGSLLCDIDVRDVAWRAPLECRCTPKDTPLQFPWEAFPAWGGLWLHAVRTGARSSTASRTGTLSTPLHDVVRHYYPVILCLHLQGDLNPCFSFAWETACCIRVITTRDGILEKLVALT
jgi:hypothetical protein